MFSEDFIDSFFDLKSRSRTIAVFVIDGILIMSFIIVVLYFLSSFEEATQSSRREEIGLSATDSQAIMEAASKAAGEAFINTSKRAPVYFGRPILVSPGYYVEIKVSGYERCRVPVLSYGFPKSWVGGAVTCLSPNFSDGRFVIHE